MVLITRETLYYRWVIAELKPVPDKRHQIQSDTVTWTINLGQMRMDPPKEIRIKKTAPRGAKDDNDTRHME